MLSRSPIGFVAIGAAAMALAGGCHAGSAGNLTARPSPVLPKLGMTTTQAIERHNINAGLVQALEARPMITVTSAQGSGRVDGRMALERPRNFTLQLSNHGSNLADIGSNQDEFWFWTKNNKSDNAVYVCSYDEVENITLSAAFQPDWVVEAMGLRTISPEEARSMTTDRGPQYGSIKLSSTRRGSGGETLTKETIIDESTGNILEHRLYQGSGQKRSLLASASVSDYQNVPNAGSNGEMVSLPKKFRLQWVPEKLALEIQLNQPILSNGFDQKRRDDMFAEPLGHKRLNLAELAPRFESTNAGTSRGTTARQTRQSDELESPRMRITRPAPINPQGTGVQIQAPEPMAASNAVKPALDPVSLSTDLGDGFLPRPTEEIIRPGVPRGGSL